jgi:hypothetical protein
MNQPLSQSFKESVGDIKKKGIKRKRTDGEMRMKIEGSKREVIQQVEPG